MLHNAKTFKTKDVNKRPHMRRMDLTAALNAMLNLIMSNFESNLKTETC